MSKGFDFERVATVEFLKLNGFMNYTLSSFIPTTLAAVALSSASSFAQIIPDAGFESFAIGAMRTDAEPDTVNNLDLGWYSGFEVVNIAAGGNPGVAAEFSSPNPNNAEISIINIFSAPVGGFAIDQVLSFEYELTSLGGTPNFADNSLTVELFGNNNNTQAFNSALRDPDIGGGNGANWSGALATISLSLDTPAPGYVLAESTPISAATLNTYDYLGIRVLSVNIADGLGQPGQEQLLLDNFAFAPIPEPGFYGAALGLAVMGLVILRRRRS